MRQCISFGIRYAGLMSVSTITDQHMRVCVYERDLWSDGSQSIPILLAVYKTENGKLLISNVSYFRKVSPHYPSLVNIRFIFDHNGFFLYCFPFACAFIPHPVLSSFWEL